MTRISLAGARIDETADVDSVHRISEDPKRNWERWWQWGGELLNPILVKEVRQSLKSRQFEVSFGLTLIAAVGWTLLFMSFSVPRIYYMPEGGMMLLRGYAFILLVPLLIIIPFAAFRSLTSEVEDSTFELLSITSLSAKQIVTGKMATAALQILLYVSALAPCIVLTYMLRGVSLVAIGVLLGATVIYSVMLVSGALMVATVSRTRAGQSGMSVLLLAVLVISFFTFSSFIVNDALESFVSENSLPRVVSVWLFAVVTVLIAAFSLMMQTAAAAIDFPSENKSTPIRKRLLVLLGLLLFWFAMGMSVMSRFAYVDLADICIGTLIPFFIFWMGLGGLVCGERGIISPRARRTLPSTFIGRVFLTWLSPGAGLGYVFVVVVFAAVVCFLVGTVSSLASLGRTMPRLEILAAVGYVLTCFVAFYVGLCRLCMLALGRKINAPMVASFSLLIVLNLVVQVIPYYVASYFNDFQRVGYEWHQSLNVYLAVSEIVGSGWSAFLGNMILLSLASLAVFGLNLLLTTKDVMILKISAPERVLLETKPAEVRTAPIDPFAID